MNTTNRPCNVQQTVKIIISRALARLSIVSPCVAGRAKGRVLEGTAEVPSI